jgi:hypothetical protein
MANETDEARKYSVKFAGQKYKLNSKEWAEVRDWERQRRKEKRKSAAQPRVKQPRPLKKNASR